MQLGKSKTLADPIIELMKLAKKGCVASCIKLACFFDSEEGGNPYLGFLYWQWAFKHGAMVDVSIIQSCNVNTRMRLVILQRLICEQRDRFLRKQEIWRVLNNLHIATALDSSGKWQTDIELLAAVITHFPTVVRAYNASPPAKDVWSKLAEVLDEKITLEQIDFFLDNGIQNLPNVVWEKISEPVKGKNVENLMREFFRHFVNFDHVQALIITLANIIKHFHSSSLTITINEIFALRDIQWLLKFIPPSCTKLHLKGVLKCDISFEDFKLILAHLPLHISVVDLSGIKLKYLEKDMVAVIWEQTFLPEETTASYDAILKKIALMKREAKTNSVNSHRTLVLRNDEWSREVINQFHQQVIGKESKEEVSVTSSDLIHKDNGLFQDLGINCDSKGPLKLIYDYLGHRVTIRLGPPLSVLPMLALHASIPVQAKKEKSKQQKSSVKLPLIAGALRPVSDDKLTAAELKFSVVRLPSMQSKTIQSEVKAAASQANTARLKYIRS